MADALIELFAEVLQVDAARLSDATAPDNLAKWDSLAAMNLVSAIEDKFDITLSTRDIIKMTSIGLARKTLQEKNIKV